MKVWVIQSKRVDEESKRVNLQMKVWVGQMKVWVTQSKRVDDESKRVDLQMKVWAKKPRAFPLQEFRDLNPAQLEAAQVAIRKIIEGE